MRKVIIITTEITCFYDTPKIARISLEFQIVSAALIWRKNDPSCFDEIFHQLFFDAKCEGKTKGLSQKTELNSISILDFILEDQNLQNQCVVWKIRLNSIKFSFSFTKLSATRRPLAIMESGRPAILAALNPWDLLQGPAATEGK